MNEFGPPLVSTHANTKGGKMVLTRNVASEYGAYNIQCKGIDPGHIATDLIRFFSHVADAVNIEVTMQNNSVNPDVSSNSIASIPTARFGRARRSVIDPEVRWKRQSADQSLLWFTIRWARQELLPVVMVSMQK
ncbi:hypothetical protein FJU08_21690 [Martelella alba]|uniref:Uncharacterized protein n=2 Tax=Martelella alba TaxID=2590451 RepID=A0A506U0N6_9HYPH|nr:hypothetical protein FJU08_21690 [Martelella alba]